MKGSDLIQIATAVYGLKWFDQLCQDLGIKDTELTELAKAENLPGPVAFALSEIATKYMVRVESMQVNNNIRDALLAGNAADKEQAAYMAGIVQGMTLVLKAFHGEPGELKALAKDKNFEQVGS